MISCPDNVSTQQFYGARSLGLSLQLATSQIQHCYDTLQTSPAPNHTHSEHTSLSALGEAEVEAVTDVPAGVSLERLRLYDCSEETMNALSVPLPAVRVWLQWMVYQRELWRQWSDLLDNSVM